MQHTNCPICTKEYSITLDDVYWYVCSGCHHLFSVKSGTLIDHGETPRISPDLDTRLKLGSTGHVRGRWFEVIGRIHFCYAEDPEGDFWDEWFVRFKDDSVGYILTEDNESYFYAKRSEISRSVPEFAGIEVGQVLQIEGYETQVFEVDTAFIRAFEGQVPDHPLPGVLLDYFDGLIRNYVVCVEYHDGKTMLHYGIELGESDLEID